MILDPFDVSAGRGETPRPAALPPFSVREHGLDLALLQAMGGHVEVSVGCCTLGNVRNRVSCLGRYVAALTSST